MAASLRRQMLAGYKRVLRARLVAFKEDTLMLEDSRKQLKIEVLKNKDVADPAKLGAIRSELSCIAVVCSLFVLSFLPYYGSP